MKQPRINLTDLKQYLKNASQVELMLDITEIVENSAWRKAKLFIGLLYASHLSFK